MVRHSVWRKRGSTHPGLAFGCRCDRGRHCVIGAPDMTTHTRTLPQAFARFRRLRRSQALRDLVRETRLSPQRFVYPLFVAHGENVRREIESMPGQYQLSLDRLAAEAEELTS